LQTANCQLPTANCQLPTENCQLKKLLHISLLLVFILFQGGRVLMYLECRFTNTITTPNCDCVQILADAKPGADAIPASNHASHKHLPEEFEMLTTNLQHTCAPLNTANTPTQTDDVPAGVRTDIFHPPIS
jgi:hypothetical protein